MTSNPTAKEEEQNLENAMIIEGEELMVPPLTVTDEGIPSTRNTTFLNPRIPIHQPLPEPPSQSLPSDPKIIRELSKLINFKGRKVPNDSWKTWVDNLLPTHQVIWKKAGIFDAIKSSTFIVKRDDELIVKLAHFWCPETNTFVFPWGECTITLEDVMILGGFSVLGESILNPNQNCNFGEIHGDLVNSCKEIKRKNNYHVPFYEWIKYFKGKGGELEHVGLIVQWLSRYVFCVDQFDIDVNTFGFAVTLAQGSKIALGPAVLASIYRDLTLLKRKIVAFNGGCEGDDVKSKLVLWSPMQLVQLWAWERFPALSPKPKSLLAGEQRVARWHDVYKLKSDRVRYGLESAAGMFVWRPYAKNIENWEFPKFYSDEGMWVVVNQEADEEWLSFARFLRVAELVGMDCVEQYLPHRVGLQFGLDQDIADSVPRLNDDLNLAWSRYDQPFDGLKIYVPPRLLDGDVTVRYSKLWTRISPPQDDLAMVPEKKRKRKRVNSNSKVKETPNRGEPPLCPSQTNNEIIEFDSSRSGKEIPTEKLVPFKNMASQPINLVDETVTYCGMNEIDFSMGAHGSLFVREPYNFEEVTGVTAKILHHSREEAPTEPSKDVIV